jgi:hypothetical protein
MFQVGKLELIILQIFELYFAGAQAASIYQSDTSFPLYINTAGGPIYLDTGVSGATHLNIVGGNVSIGTRNPGEKLEISGNIKLSGYINVAGSCIRKVGSSIVISDV